MTSVRHNNRASTPVSPGAMLWFRFEAEGEDGTPVSGVLTAPDLMAAREGVEARRLLPVKVLEIAGIDGVAW